MVLCSFCKDGRYTTYQVGIATGFQLSSKVKTLLKSLHLTQLSSSTLSVAMGKVRTVIN
jgi:hypothetical protein